MNRTFGAILCGLVLMGCGSSNSTQAPPHTAEEDAAIRAAKAMTPQQQIEQVEKGPLSPSQKEALIQSIKAKNGLP